jgi:hypothetical protein
VVREVGRARPEMCRVGPWSPAFPLPGSLRQQIGGPGPRPSPPHSRHPPPPAPQPHPRPHMYHLEEHLHARKVKVGVPHALGHQHERHFALGVGRRVRQADGGVGAVAEKALELGLLGAARRGGAGRLGVRREAAMDATQRRSWRRRRPPAGERQRRERTQTRAAAVFAASPSRRPYPGRWLAWRRHRSTLASRAPCRRPPRIPNQGHPPWPPCCRPRAHRGKCFAPLKTSRARPRVQGP